MMEQRVRSRGRGGAVKNTAMQRLARYNQKLDSAVVSIATAPQLTHPTHTDSQHLPGKINVPLARLKPQYREVMDADSKAVSSLVQTRTGSSASVGKAKHRPTPVDSNNNTTNIGTGTPIIHFPRRYSDSSYTGEMSEVFSGAKTESLKERVVKCICNRPKTHILCTICGYSSYGHIRIPCYAHLRVTYLLDMALCPRCNSGRLMEVSPLEPVK